MGIQYIRRGRECVCSAASMACEALFSLLVVSVASTTRFPNIKPPLVDDKRVVVLPAHTGMIQS